MIMTLINFSNLSWSELIYSIYWDVWGFGGRWPSTSCAGYIPGHCLPLLPLLSASKDRGWLSVRTGLYFAHVNSTNRSFLWSM